MKIKPNTHTNKDTDTHRWRAHEQTYTYTHIPKRINVFMCTHQTEYSNDDGET